MSYRKKNLMTTPPNTAIEINGLSKTYHIYDSPMARLYQGISGMAGGKVRLYRTFDALKPVSINIEKGESVAIVGRNGSGKSTLLQLISGTLPATSGSVKINGRISALLELGAGFNPEFTGRENIFLNASILGMSKEQIEKHYDAIVDFSGLGSSKVEEHVKTYSSGMVVRLAFAVAVAVDPDILIVDEALAVGDERFQKKCYNRIREMQKNGATILFVSHAAQTITELCKRALLFDDGELLMDGPAKQVIYQYRKLLYCPPEVRPEIKESIINIKPQDTEDISNQEGFAEGMVPESKVDFPSQGAEILECELIGANGKVNMLSMRERYKLNVKVKFTEACKEARVNFRIHTISGVDVSGYNSSAGNNQELMAEIKPGDVFEINFSFENALLPGTYFITVNVTGVVKGKRELMKRINDALMFKVTAPSEDEPFFGMVSLNEEVEKIRKV